MSAARVAGFLGAEEDEGSVGGGTGCEVRGAGEGVGEGGWDGDWSEGCGGCGGFVDVICDEGIDGGWGDVFDYYEGGEEEDGCWV